MGILHVVHGIVIRVPGEGLKVQGQRRVDRVTDERVARRVDSDFLNEFLQSHDRACALGELELLPAPGDLHQLPDQDFRRISFIAIALRNRLQTMDVAVMVCSKEIDAGSEAALTLVDVVRGIGCEVGQLAVSLDQYPILVISEVRCAEPGRSILFEDVSLLAQPCKCQIDC